MTNKPKNIGTAGETSVVKYLQAHGYDDAERLALRGQLDIGDVRWIKGVHLEVKAGNMAHKASWQQCLEWMKEAEVEGNNAGAPCYLVVKRKGHAVAGNWRFFTRLSALSGLMIHDSTTVEMPFADAVRLAGIGGLYGFGGQHDEG